MAGFLVLPVGRYHFYFNEGYNAGRVFSKKFHFCPLEGCMLVGVGIECKTC